MDRAIGWCCCDQRPARDDRDHEARDHKASHGTVAETVARLIAEVEARGMKLFTTIDHSAEARSAGLELRETRLVVFGNPRTGTPIMQAVPLAGLDLPLKVLVRADPGRTCVSYIAPAELAARYQLSDELAAGLAGIDALTDAAIGR
ncbi:MAG: DUF302 domain-containing protein [Solirubrobacteraceae bacterium]